MVFSSLCFYEKQVTDNNWSDTSTYFLVNFALVFYYPYTVGIQFYSQNCMMDLSFSLLFCLDAEISHCCATRPAYRTRAATFNGPSCSQLLASPHGSRFCFWLFLVYFFLLQQCLQCEPTKGGHYEAEPKTPYLKAPEICCADEK